MDDVTKQTRLEKTVIFTLRNPLGFSIKKRFVSKERVGDQFIINDTITTKEISFRALFKLIRKLFK